MPAVIASAALGALSGGIGAAIAGTSIWAGALIGGGLSALQSLLAPKPPKFDLDTGAARVDTRHTVREAVSPAHWVLGRARVGGTLVFYRESGRTLDVALVLSEDACDGIERLWANGEEIAIARAARAQGGHLIGPAAGSEYRGRIAIYEYFAADGTQGDSLRAAARNDWTAEHKLNGVSWVHVHLHQPDYGNDIDRRFWNRFPALEFLIRGLRLTWPGLDTPVWTDNAAALRYWWLTARRGIPAAAIDAASVRAAHSLCASQVTVGLPAGYEDYDPTSTRYTANRVVYADDDPERVEAEMDFAWAGHAVELDGVYHFRPGAERPVSRTITPDDIVSVPAIQPAPAIQDRINAATLTLAQSREHDWLEAALPEYSDSEGETRDGEKLTKDLGKRAFVADPIAGGRLLAIALRRARASATYSYRLKPGPAMEWMTVLPTDRVLVDDPEHGLADYSAMVTRTVVNPDWSVTLTLVEQPVGIYADTTVLPPLKPRKLSIASPRAVSAPEGFAARHGFAIGRDGTVHWSIDVSWTDTPHGTRLILTGPGETQRVLATGTSHRFTVDGTGDYRIEAYHITLDGFGSPAVSASVSFDWSEVPVPAPAIVSAEQYGTLLQIVAHPIANRDVQGVEVRYTRGQIDGASDLTAITADGWLAALRADVALAASIAGDQPLVADALIPATGRYRLFCRLFNRVGNYGPVVEIGYKRLVIPAIETLSPQQWPLWAGTLNNLYLWPHDGRYRLIPDYDDRDDLTVDRLDGKEGWPFGPVEGYGAAMDDDGAWYETEVVDLGEDSNIDVIATIDYHAPPNPAVTTETGYDIYAYHGLTDVRADMTETRIVGRTVVDAVRYLAFRVHLETWRGAALARFAPEIRRLA